MIERMDQLQKLQVDQQKQYAESLTDLTETIKIQSQLSESLTSAENDLDSYIHRFIPEDAKRIQALANNVSSENNLEEYYGSEREQVYKKAKLLDDQIQELDLNCKDIQEMIQQKQGGKLTQMGHDTALVSEFD